LHSQRERLEAFCKSQEGWSIISHQEDRSTGARLDRPGLQAALDLARGGMVDMLLVYDRRTRRRRRPTRTAPHQRRTAEGQSRDPGARR
jgi:site-specific DNA recombinase